MIVRTIRRRLLVGVAERIKDNHKLLFVIPRMLITLADRVRDRLGRGCSAG